MSARGRFPSPLVCTWLPQLPGEARRIHIDADFAFVRPSGEILTVPAGYLSDGASVPELVWNIEPPFGDCLEAAMHHDWLYSSKTRPRAEADLVFLEGMTVLGLAWWKRSLLYRAVRMGGARGYGLPAEYAAAQALQSVRDISGLNLTAAPEGVAQP